MKRIYKILTIITLALSTLTMTAVETVALPDSLEKDSVVTVIQLVSLKDKSVTTRVVGGNPYAKEFETPQDSSAIPAAVAAILPITAAKSIDDVSEFSSPEELRNYMFNQKVIVRGDTVPIVMKDRNFSRFDRGLFNFLFIPKGQWHFSLTASYGDLNTEDTRLLNLLKDLDLGVKIFSIKPSVGYFFRSNQELGVQFNYTNTYVNLESLSVKFDEDLKFDLHDVSYDSKSFGFDVFYRNYIGLSALKRFGFYNEVDLSYSSGNSTFIRYYSDEKRETNTRSTTWSLNFSPGICIFLMDYVSFHVSFGVFGVYLTKEKQTTNGIEEGSRTSSGANFKFNLFNINFGIGVHI